MTKIILPFSFNPDCKVAITCPRPFPHPDCMVCGRGLMRQVRPRIKEQKTLADEDRGLHGSIAYRERRQEKQDQEYYQKVREAVAEQEHEQWMRWAKNLIPELKQLTQLHLPYGDIREAGNCHCKTCERIKRWESLFIPYSELTTEQKDQDRIEADSILNLKIDGREAIGVIAEDNDLIYNFSFLLGKYGQFKLYDNYPEFFNSVMDKIRCDMAGFKRIIGEKE